jgi:assimilatory nitrate reductase catalytic subunit
MVKKIARAPGKALADFAIFKLVAEYWGCGEMFAEWADPEAVFEIMKRLSRGRPCDITGIRDYRMIDEMGGIQWPFTQDDAAAAGDGARGASEAFAQRRLFTDGRFYHDDARARFIFESPRAMPEPPDDEYPFTLLTGRGSASQWHTQTRTGKSAILRRLYPHDIYAHVNPADAKALAVRPNQIVRVASRRGRLHARAFVTPTVQRGQVFIPMHYEATNRLTNPVFDPYSKQPSYKQCAVRLRRVEHWETQT